MTLSKSATDTMRFRCPHCSVILRSKLKNGGKQQRCPKCEKTFKIPKPKSKSPPQNETRAETQPKEREETKKKQEQLLPVVCSVCSTRMYARESQIGSSLECPDCFTQNLVTPAPETKKRTSPRMDASMNYDIEPEEQIAVTSERGQDLLDKADDEIVKELEAAPKIPSKPFVTGVYTYPFRLLIFPTLIGMTLGWTVLIPCVVLALTLPFMLPVAAIVGILVALPTLVSFQKVVENTSNADDESDCRPGGMFAIIDWAFESVPLAFALFLSVLPVALAVTSLKLQPQFLAFAGITVYLFFPLIYLSMLENASAAGVFSRPVFGSLGKTPGTWIKFYLLSGIVLGLVGGAIYGFIAWRAQFGLNGPSITEIIGGLLVLTATTSILLTVYFRLLGRVALVLSEKITIQDPESDSAEDEQSKVETSDSISMGV